MFRAIFTFAIMLFFLYPSMVSASPQWRSLFEKNGIRGYERAVPGTGMVEFKAEGTVKAGIEILVAVMQDKANYSKWMGLVFESRDVKEAPDGNMVYLCFKSPWPVEDREVIAAHGTESDLPHGLYAIRFKAAANPPVPVNPDRVRIQQFTGAYVFEFISWDRTRVTYTHMSHPGGSLSVNLFNKFTQDLPYKNIMGMRKMAANPVYASAARKQKNLQALEAQLHDRKNVEAALRTRLSKSLENEELTNRVLDKGALVDQLMAAGVSYENLKREVSGRLGQIIASGEIARYVEEKDLARKLSGNKDLCAKIAKDPAIPAQILEDAAPLQRILARSARKQS